MDTHAALYEQGKARLEALRQLAPVNSNPLSKKCNNMALVAVIL
ncbi:hypothetical protein SPWS13_0346 [Shewanella putrefaciens]|nr:hypothetical protein SPWS13_0346 [Shewanella putrefaciens]